MKRFLLLWAALALLAACGKTPERDTIPTLILDTDIGSSTDDLFALEMAWRYQKEGLCRVLGVVVDREGEACAACADVMNTYFGHGEVPLGLVRNGIKNPAVYVNYQPLPTLTGADGIPLFQRSVQDYSALPDGWQLYRKLLASQPDGSVSIVSIGFLTCLAQLLESAPDQYAPLSGPELVRKKVKRLYLMGGSFDQSGILDYNICQGLPFAQTFFRLWPASVEIMFSPGEVGQGINYTPDQVLAHYRNAGVHPIRQVYQTYGSDEGQRMWDPLPLIQAVEGDRLFTLSPTGTVNLSAQGETLFSPSPGGNARYQKPGSAAWNAAMLERIGPSGRP